KHASMVEGEIKVLFLLKCSVCGLLGSCVATVCGCPDWNLPGLNPGGSGGGLFGVLLNFIPPTLSTSLPSPGRHIRVLSHDFEPKCTGRPVMLPSFICFSSSLMIYSIIALVVSIFALDQKTYTLDNPCVPKLSQMKHYMDVRFNTQKMHYESLNVILFVLKVTFR
ncbi:hypothetical protein L9F63_024326, partial [Diploptera punctata]